MKRKQYLPERTKKPAIFRHILSSIEIWREVEQVADTPESMADGFTYLAELITKNKYTWNNQKPGDVYDSYDRAVRGWRDSTKKYLNIDLPEPPALPGNDYYAGMIGLAQYCQTCAKTLIKPDSSTPDEMYISSADALAYAAGRNRRLSATTLSKLDPSIVRCEQRLDKNGKPYRKNVNFGDLKKYIMTLPKIDPDIDDEDIDNFLRNKETTTASIRKEQVAKHRESNPRTEQGYERLARKIADPND